MGSTTGNPTAYQPSLNNFIIK